MFEREDIRRLSLQLFWRGSKLTVMYVRNVMRGAFGRVS